MILNSVTDELWFFTMVPVLLPAICAGSSALFGHAASISLAGRSSALNAWSASFCLMKLNSMTDELWLFTISELLPRNAWILFTLVRKTDRPLLNTSVGTRPSALSITFKLGCCCCCIAFIKKKK